MENVIDTDAPLDYIGFQLFPEHDRFEACACNCDVIENIASGLLGQLLLHSPRLKDQFSKGSRTSFQIKRPKELDSSQWFTKATLTRYFNIVSSMDILNSSISVLNEINQLEETKKVDLSLYTKDENETAFSDASKNELLRTIELRLAALKTKSEAAFNRAAGTNCFPEHIHNMEKLAQYLGNMNLRNTLCKFAELSPMDQKVDLAVNSINKSVNRSDENTRTKKLSGLDTPVKYAVSPAKAAQIERQSSFDSSEDEQPSGERSRSLARSASPRRSASPMRRVQIGRSGSRRATALTIKSLNYFPGRDKTESCRDNYSSEEEGSEKPPRKSNSNALRISVKDAISLFENKEKDSTSDVQKRRSTLDASLSTNKSVLRRWSSGLGDPEGVSESSSWLNSGNAEIKFIHEYSKLEEDAKVDEILYSIEERMSKPIESEPDILVIQHEEDTEKLTASAEWNRQKEAELNEMLKKMMQSKPVRNCKIIPRANGDQDVAREKRGGFYDQYKGKRDEKLRGETTEKRAEKHAQFRAMQQVLEQRKSAMASANVTAITRSKSSFPKPATVGKTFTPSATAKKESPEHALANKTQPKTKPSPVRKSTGASPAKTPCGTSSAGTTPTRRKPQPGPTGSKPNPKGERPLQRPKLKPVKATHTDIRKSTEVAVQKHEPPLLKSTKISKSNTKTQAISEKESLKSVAKPSFYSKVTKKNSIVPLESKPFLRRGSGVSPIIGSVVKKKAASLPTELMKMPENLVATEKTEIGVDTLDLQSQHISEGDVQTKVALADLILEAQLDTQKVFTEISHSEQAINNFDDSLIERTECELKTEAEEDLTLSPTMWLEVEERQESCIPPDDSTCKISPAMNVGPITTSNPRIRHSLSQMLLEENAEIDMTEWGNAETPPSIVYQKEPSKGLKRLLKFAGPQRSSAHSNSSNFGAQRSSKRLQEHISGTASGTKATRSFFSLSALRGQQAK